MSRINKKVVLRSEFIDENEQKYPNLELREIMFIVFEKENGNVVLNTEIEVTSDDIIEIELTCNYMLQAYLINTCLDWENVDNNEELEGNIYVARELLKTISETDSNDLKDKFTIIETVSNLKEESDFIKGKKAMINDFKEKIFEILLSDMTLSEIYNQNVEIYDYNRTMEYLSNLD